MKRNAFCSALLPALLFDVAADAGCMKHLATDPGFATKADALRAKLPAELKRTNDPHVLGPGDVFDQHLPPKNEAGETKKKPKTEAGS